jgi:hypothetical protein
MDVTMKGIICHNELNRVVFVALANSLLRCNMVQLLIQAEAMETAESIKRERLQVSVHVHANIIAPEVARRKANVWLLMNAGHLVAAYNPELLIADRLVWRLEVRHGLPDLQNPGHAIVRKIGQIYLDALTGDPLLPDNFLDKLMAEANALITT